MVKNEGSNNSIIIIAGDLAHSKLEMSPELTREISELLINCAQITDTLVIPGNHDCNLNNSQRLDVLTPIVKYLQNDNVHYLKDNGLYIMKNLLFSHFGIFSNVEDYITYDKIPQTYKNQTDCHIGLFHGPLHKSVTDIDYEVSNLSVKPELFSGFDFGILGDIHKQQTIFISKKKSGNIPNGWQQSTTDIDEIVSPLPIIRYPGSLIQQNHSETIHNHGFTIWDVKSKSFEHREVHNDFGFFTAEVINGKLVTDVSTMPSKARLRFRCFATEPIEIKRILDTIKLSRDIQEVSYIRGGDAHLLNRTTESKISLQRLNDYHFQNTLIRDYVLARNPKTPKSLLNKIFEINQQTNSKLTEKDNFSNIIWRIKTFKFDNMFSYGEANIVDFSKITGISGIFGPNASGKSSILSALCFCLFDKCDRTFKASHIMNESKTSFSCEANLEIDGTDYFIRRHATRDKKENVKVTVHFWKVVNGAKVNLNDESRRSTNEVIRSYIGSFDDFVLTCLSPQKNQSNFADKGQTERKDLITKFLGIDVFDALYQISTEDLKNVSDKIKVLNKKDIAESISTIERTLAQLDDKFSRMQILRDDVTSNKDQILEQIIDIQSKIRPIEGVTESITVLEKRHNQLCIQRDSINVDHIQSEIDACDETVVDTKAKISELENQNIDSQYLEYNLKQKQLLELQSKIEVVKMDVKNKLEKVKFLDTHEYDPACKFCMKNAFVQNALLAKQELDELKPVVEDLVSSKESIILQLVELENIEQVYTTLQDLRTSLGTCTSTLNSLQSKYISAKAELSNVVERLDKVSACISRYYESLDVTKANEMLNAQLKILRKQEKGVSDKIKFANEKISDVNSDIKYYKNMLVETTGQQAELADLQLEFKACQLYNESIHRDGVPYDIIAKSIPSIEKEVNEILSQIVDFGVMLSIDGKNINTNLVYGDRTWPIELASGMESFISNLAFRISLSTISNMPKTNFIAIDEGFGSLDDDTFATIPSLFSFLRNSFDFILIISHIDQIKDFVDTQIEITKEKGFSQVTFK